MRIIKNLSYKLGVKRNREGIESFVNKDGAPAGAENFPGFINPVHGDDNLLIIQHVANLNNVLMKFKSEVR